MTYSVVGLGAGGWQIWSLHNSLRSVSQEAYEWGKETMMANKELLLWKWKDCSCHLGTMHWCVVVALDNLISTLWYNEITVFSLLACRYWSLKPYLLADKFKDLIYVKQSLFLSQLGMGWGKRQPSISVWLRPDADCWHEEALTIIVWIRNSFRNAPNSHHTHFQSHKHSQLMHFIGVPGLEPPSIQFSNVLTWMSLGLGQFC